MQCSHNIWHHPLETIQHKALHTGIYKIVYCYLICWGKAVFLEVRPISSHFYKKSLCTLVCMLHAKTSYVRKLCYYQCDCLKSHFSRVENVSGLLPGRLLWKNDSGGPFQTRGLHVKLAPRFRITVHAWKWKQRQGVLYVRVCVSNFPGLFRYHSQTSKLLSLFSLPSAKVITHTHTHSLSLSLSHSHTHTHTRTHTHTHTRKRCEIAILHHFNRGGNLAINFLTF